MIADNFQKPLPQGTPPAANPGEDTFGSLLKERKPLEEQLRAWYARWAAVYRARGHVGDPFDILYPIDKLVTESEEERAARAK